jgi:hypothetical protein
MRRGFFHGDTRSVKGLEEMSSSFQVGSIQMSQSRRRKRGRVTRRVWWWYCQKPLRVISTYVILSAHIFTSMLKSSREENMGIEKYEG